MHLGQMFRREQILRRVFADDRSLSFDELADGLLTNGQISILVERCYKGNYPEDMVIDMRQLIEQVAVLTFTMKQFDRALKDAEAIKAKQAEMQQSSSPSRPS